MIKIPVTWRDNAFLQLCEIEIKPGIITKNKEGNFKIIPIYTKIISLHAENNKLNIAYPGGLIGIGTTLDSSLTKGNGLVGKMIGYPGTLPDILTEINVKYSLLKELIGTKDIENQTKIQKFVKNEMLMINVGSNTIGGSILSFDKHNVMFKLSAPICAEKSDKIAISRRINKHWRLIGWGEIVSYSILS